MDDRKAGWFYRALEALPKIFRGGEKTGEQLYDMVLESGIESAPNPFVWGAVIRRAIQTKLIAKTGERRAMKHKASHGRSTDVYRRVQGHRR